ncbi:MAG: hypothetical protein ACYCW6_08770 [Candidatus Xenobia bacterium]
MRRRGFNLGTILAIGFLCTAIAFIVAALSTFQLNAASHASASEEALHLAEGAVNLAVMHVHDGVLSNQPYGLANESYQWVPDPTQPDRYGEYSFDSSTPWGWSTNNYDGNHNVGWQGAQVPAASVLVVGHGVAGNVSRLVEALISLPEFQYVLAVAGPLNSNGPLTAKCEPNMSALASDPNLNNATLAANIGSNGALSAGSGSYVTGDVIGDSTVSIASPSQVLGTVRQGLVTVPQIQVTSFNNAGGSTPTLSGALSSPPPISVNTYASGPLTITGDLVMANATLYVEGNLTITNGALRGTGAVFVHGNVQLTGGADLDASNMVALCTTGDVALNGPVGQSKYFQGLVYTEGAFSTSNITVAGAFVSCTSSEGTGSGSSLTLGPNTTVVYIPDAANITGTSNGSTITAMAPVTMFTTAGANTTTMPSSGTPWTPYEVGNGPSAAQAALYSALQTGMGSNPTFQNYGEITNNVSTPGLALELPSQVNFVNSNPFQETRLDVIAIQYDSSSNQFVAVTPPQITYWDNLTDTPITPAQFDARLNGQQVQLFSWHGTGPLVTGVSSSTLIPMLEQEQQIYMTTANQILSGQTQVSTTATPASVPNLTLSQFLNDTDPVHIASWREY